MVILFAPNSNTNDVYFSDNLDLYGSAPSDIAERLAPVGSVSLSPNPATTDLTLELRLDGAQTIGIELVDAAGRVLQRLSPKPYPTGVSRETIDVSTLPSGTYRAVLRSEGRQSVATFAKE